MQLLKVIKLITVISTVYTYKLLLMYNKKMQFIVIIIHILNESH